MHAAVNLFELEAATTSAMSLFIVPSLVLGLAIPYAVLYLRDSAGEERDREIGLKAALYFMFSLAMLTFLIGLTVLIVDFLNNLEPTGSSRNLFSEFSQTQRTAVALMVSGIAISLFHLVVIQGYTNDRRFPAARRVFVGWRLAVCGLVVMTAFTILIVQVFQKDPRWEELKTVFGILLVWGPAWLVHLLLMRFYGTAPVPRLRRTTED